MFNLFAKLRQREGRISWLNKGLPPDNLTHTQACSKQWTAFWEDLPDTCVECGSSTERIETDPWDIEGVSQFMVVTQFCPYGCGYTPWIA
jgi:hypothetical protein